MAGREIAVNPDRRPRFKTFTPFGDQVVVWVHRKDETEAGLLLPDGVADPDRTPTCTVIAVGPNCKQIKEGDELVLPNATQGIVMCHGGSGRLVLFKEEMVFGGIVDEQYRASAGRSTDGTKKKSV